MKKWEYLTTEEGNTLAGTLNGYGDQGWELVSVTYPQDIRFGEIRDETAFACLIFKRPLPEPSPKVETDQ